MTCSPDDVACVIRELTNAVRSSGPSWLDVVAVLVGLAGVATTTFIGFAALQTSKRATEIAEGQRRTAYDTALDAALADLFAAIERYTSALWDWQQAEEKRTREQATPPPYGMVFVADSTPRPLMPPPAGVSIRYQAAQLRTRGADVAAMHAFGSRLSKVFEREPGLQADLMGDLVRDIVKWRAGTPADS